MAVYARGYRTYSGGFQGPAASRTIWREAYGAAFRSKGFRMVGLLFLVWFVIWAVALYFTLGVEEAARTAGAGLRPGGPAQALVDPAAQLKTTLAMFYGGVSVLSGLLALLVGGGLVSDDLRTRALPLYLVRPISAGDYVIGKALVLPTLLLWVCLVPGLFFYLLVGMWRPPGETASFLRENLDIVHVIVQQYLIAAGSYTGLMLFLSSRSPRRGAVMGVAAAVLFLGSMLAMSSVRMLPSVGAYLRYLGLPFNYESGFALSAAEAMIASKNRLAQTRATLPDPDVALWIALGLLLVGLGSVWRRARTVEVTE